MPPTPRPFIRYAPKELEAMIEAVTDDILNDHTGTNPFVYLPRTTVQKMVERVIERLS